MNKNGFVSIIALILMLILLSFSLYTNELMAMNSSLSYSSLNKLNAYYDAESQILSSLYTESNYYDKIIPYISNSIRTRDFFKNLTIRDYQDNKILCRVSPQYMTKYFYMESESRFKNIKLNLTCKLQFVNDIFLAGEGLIENSTSSSNQKLTDKIYKNTRYFKNHPDFQFHDKFLSLDDRVDNSLINLSGLDLANEKIILNIYEDDIDKKLTMVNDYGELIILEGIVYIEGDLYLESDLDFKGILVLKDGNINLAEGVNFNSMGMVICDNFFTNSNDSKITSYQASTIFNYGAYFPGFFDIQILNYEY